jgi:uncharacterized protein DUF4402
VAICKFIVAAALAVAAVPAGAAPVPATKNATGRALILIPLTLTKVDDLDFGTVVSSSTSGSVSIAAKDGARSVTGGVTMIPSDPGARGVIAGGASEGEQVRIFLAPPGSLTDPAGDSMGIAMNLQATTLTIDSTRAFSVGIGGTVTVGANQPEGVYTGTFTVLAQYN